MLRPGLLFQVDRQCWCSEIHRKQLRHQTLLRGRDSKENGFDLFGLAVGVSGDENKHSTKHTLAAASGQYFFTCQSIVEHRRETELHNDRSMRISLEEYRRPESLASC